MVQVAPSERCPCQPGLALLRALLFVCQAHLPDVVQVDSPRDLLPKEV